MFSLVTLPPLVVTALGSPKPAMETVHGYGGLVIAEGSPEDVAKVEISHTGRFLRPLLDL